MTSYRLWKNQIPPSALGRKLLAMGSPSGAPCHPIPSWGSAATFRGPGGSCTLLCTEWSSCSWSWPTHSIGPSWGPAPLGPLPVLTQWESGMVPTQGSAAACLLRKALPRAEPQECPQLKLGPRGHPSPKEVVPGHAPPQDSQATLTHRATETLMWMKV